MDQHWTHSILKHPAHCAVGVIVSTSHTRKPEAESSSVIGPGLMGAVQDGDESTSTSARLPWPNLWQPRHCCHTELAVIFFFF